MTGWWQRARVPVLLAMPAMVFFAAFYRVGLTAWFQADDFAWLSLWRQVHSAEEAIAILFRPFAQGTIRPLSERIPFLVLPALFGVVAWPFRLLAYGIQAVNLALLASLALRLSGSRPVAALAPVFWAVSTSLAIPMVWIAPANQLGCAFFFLAALRTWIAYCDTGQARWLAIHWVLFLLGFGALELFVVYPAMALAWTLATGQTAKHWRALLAMFALSAAYSVWHQTIAPTPTGVYQLHVDASVFSTLGQYLTQIFGGPLLENLPVGRALRWAGRLTPYVVGLPLVAYLLIKRRPYFLVPLALIFAPLAPVLPLRDHVTHYYLVTPAAGLAILLAWLVVECYANSGWALQWAALGVAGLFLIVSMQAARGSRDFYAERSQRVKTLMLGLVSARQNHPDAALVLTGVDGQQFFASIGSDALEAFELHNVYLAPGSAGFMEPIAGEPSFTKWELAEGPLHLALSQGEAEVYAPAGSRLRNITATYRAVLLAVSTPALASRVEPAGAPYAEQLGPGWLGTGGDARWIGARAEAFLAPVGRAKFVVEGYAPPVQFRDGPFRISIAIEGQPVGQFELHAPGGLFRFEFPVNRPSVSTPKPKTPKWRVTFVADHTVPLPDGGHASVLISRFSLDPV